MDDFYNFNLDSKVAIFSDLHIGVHRDSTVWHNIALDWCRWFRDTIKAQDIKQIIFCGDFFHYRDTINVQTLNVGQQILDMLAEFEILMIPGNHCSYYKDHAAINSLSIFKNYPNIHVFDQLTNIQYGQNTKVTFAPWGTSLNKIPKTDVLFGHFEIETFRLNSYKICDHGFSAETIYDKTPLTITGHFHMRSERTTERGTILYVGNPFQMDFGDLGGTKGIYILDFDTFDYSFIENTISPIFQKLTLSGLVDLQMDLDELTGKIKDNIVKLIIDRKISTADSEFLFKQIRALKPLVLDVEHDINFNCIMGSDEGKDLSGVDIEQAIVEFINIMDIGNKEPVINYVLDLYRRAKNI